MKQTDYTDSYVRWNNSMKKTHKILVPDMLPHHFMLFQAALENEGYDVEVLKNNSRTVIDEGLKHVHNDTCYPCLCVVGQYIDALKSGKYDLDKTALLITQTGGGCRASNYLSLMRKAIHIEFPQIPILSLNFSGLEKDSSLKMTLGLVRKLAYGAIYGDVIMWCYNQTKPYEITAGEADIARTELIAEVGDLIKRNKYKKYPDLTKKIIQRFARIKRSGSKTKVGIVGEIYVKYSELGNNGLEKMLIKEGCEPIVPPLLDFILYTMLGKINDARMYGLGKFTAAIYKLVYNYLIKIQRRVNNIFSEDGSFEPMHNMERLRSLADEVIDQGVKMGEGWLIPAEMAALYESGVANIVCAQPFGCLPNHIVGKGTIRSLKSKYKDINIVAIDYDPSASHVNQENRIKLMLAATRDSSLLAG